MVALDGEKIKQQSYMLLGKLIRTKDPSRMQEGRHAVDSKLNKVLTTLDLTSLGVGSCAGTGMYLVAGMVAKTIAGPGVILSFTIAAIASIFSGVCYAEFGVRVPNTSGGAYVYSYVTVGELMAFIIGWNMVLEELIGTSACACALSACFDSIANGAISSAMENSFGTLFGEPPDLLAFALTLMMGGVLVAGVRKSVLFNNALNIVNFVVWIFIMIAGFFYVDTTNWSKHGGFLPMGWSGVLTGAATCFYAFIGFDIIATTGEEAVNARKSIPYSIVFSLVIILIAYVSSSAIITLMVPYEELDQDSALVEVFGQVGAHKCKNFVAIGALAGLTVSMFGSMFSLPRIVYAMAKDGLVFKSLSNVWGVTGTPAVATIVFGLGAAVAAMFISLTVLVEMMSIGTLLAYTLVSTCVLILRYQPHSTTLLEMLPESIRTPLAGTPLPGSPTRSPSNTNVSTALGIPGAGPVTPQKLTAALQQNGGARIPPSGLPLDHRVTVKKVMRSSPDSDDTGNTEEGSDLWRREDDYMVSDRYENRYYGAVPTAARVPRWYDRYLEILQQRFPTLFPWVEEGPCTEDSGRQVMKLVGLLYVNVLLFDILLVACIGELEGHSPLASFFSIVFFISIIVILLLISRKPQNRRSLPFLAPGLPWVPAVAIIINVYLIFKLSILTLIRFVLWMTIGFIIYFYYGIKKSVVGLGQEGDIELHVTSKQANQTGLNAVTPPLAHSLSPNANSTSTGPAPPSADLLHSSATTTPSLTPTIGGEGRKEGGVYVSPNPNNPFR
ncbi:cationic amino acid transporter 2-like isoform X1 [Eriocheir sinensis]|uniref:cationic amino acid transporter 2-like isoform X1 n=1 Tax=Eriocheir sinensis TaxID=95602 RepID=UPI0021CAA199|nr:cationic amino acid transporter 2-like isoform X1 [Eriocheir sinensis]XP_050717876.1 cationic amino acid transporter 2-like isoform X1 [Eriocheir sinensis]